jgi:hypothetical protein
MEGGREMKIEADIRITHANEEEKNRIEKLFMDSQGRTLPFFSSILFPPRLRFYTDLVIEKLFAVEPYNLRFGIFNIASDKPLIKNEMDYRALLKKYMAFIMYEESIDYISKIGDVWDGSGMSLTEEEKFELTTISQEIIRERQE